MAKVLRILITCLIFLVGSELAYTKNFNLDLVKLHKVQYALQYCGVQDEFERDNLAISILKAADENGIDELVLVSIIKKESNFNSKLIGKSGEVGLTQIMPKYWVKFLGISKKQLKNPDTNISSCAKILRHQLDKEQGSYKKALRNYNSNTKRGVRYAKQVLDLSKQLRSINERKPA